MSTRSITYGLASLEIGTQKRRASASPSALRVAHNGLSSDSSLPVRVVALSRLVAQRDERSRGRSTSRRRVRAVSMRVCVCHCSEFRTVNSEHRTVSLGSESPLVERQALLQCRGLLQIACRAITCSRGLVVRLQARYKLNCAAI